jgi:hypothetical protein
MIDIASYLAPRLRGRVGDKLQDQVSIGAVWLGSQSKRPLDGLEELRYLGLWKTNDQPSEARQ